MARKLKFEVRDYSGGAPGVVASTPKVWEISVVNEASAKARAGRLAKRNGGPVDLARAGTSDWSRRYITTAAPSEFHASGYRFERLDG